MVFELPGKAAGHNDAVVTSRMRDLELPPPKRNRLTGE
jgi:hypothetical protein